MRETTCCCFCGYWACWILQKEFNSFFVKIFLSIFVFGLVPKKHIYINVENKI